jgi:hypothetical protein
MTPRLQSVPRPCWVARIVSLVRHIARWMLIFALRPARCAASARHRERTRPWFRHDGEGRVIFRSFSGFRAGDPAASGRPGGRQQNEPPRCRRWSAGHPADRGELHRPDRPAGAGQHAGRHRKLRGAAQPALWSSPEQRPDQGDQRLPATAVAATAGGSRASLFSDGFKAADNNEPIGGIWNRPAKGSGSPPFLQVRRRMTPSASIRLRGG